MKMTPNTNGKVSDLEAIVLNRQVRLDEIDKTLSNFDARITKSKDAKAIKKMNDRIEDYKQYRNRFLVDSLKKSIVTLKKAKVDLYKIEDDKIVKNVEAKKEDPKDKKEATK